MQRSGETRAAQNCDAGRRWGQGHTPGTHPLKRFKQNEGGGHAADQSRNCQSIGPAHPDGNGGGVGKAHSQASQTGSQDISWWTMAALTSTGILPLVIIGVALERYIVKSLTAGAVK